MSFQRGSQFLVRHIVDHRPTYNHDVERGQRSLARAKTFPHQTLDAVSCYRAAGTLFGNGEAKPGMLASVGAHQHRESSVTGSDCAFEDSAKLCGFNEPRRALKTTPRRDPRQ